MSNNMAVNCEPLEKALEKALSTLYFANVVVEEFQEGSQQTLFDYLNTFIADLRQLEAVQASVTADVPLDVFELVDRGENPERYTALCVAAAEERATLTAGRVDALDLFHETMRSEIASCFPEQYAIFERETNGTTTHDSMVEDPVEPKQENIN